MAFSTDIIGIAKKISSGISGKGKTMKGIDVSKWQGVVDYEAVRNSGIEFVIIRAGFGKEKSQKDSCFERNYEKARAAGLKVGAYWYSYAETVEEAKREATACLSVIDGKKFDLPVYFDVEEHRQFAKGRNFVDSIITVFCDSLKGAGFTPGIYMSTSPLMAYVSESVRAKYTVWVAQYNVRCTYDGKYGIWQYSSKGSVPGVRGCVDMNICYEDFGAEAEAEVKEPRKTVDELAREVIAGKWGNGSKRKRLLAEAGYDYAKVQERVNALLR